MFGAFEETAYQMMVWFDRKRVSGPTSTLFMHIWLRVLRSVFEIVTDTC